MRKLIFILLLMTLFCSSLLAEEAAPEAPALTATAPLPIELTEGGFVPDLDGFVEADETTGTKKGYHDASLSITLEKITEDGVTYNVARVKIADGSQIRTGLEDPNRAKKNNYVHNIAKKYNAVLAISSDFFSKNTGSKNSGGFVVRQGKVFRKKEQAFKNRDMLVIDNKGDFHIIFRSNQNDLDSLMARTDINIVNVFNFGPALVAEGKVLEIPEYYKNTFNIKRPEPRCAIGQAGPLEYILVVADGRSEDSNGATGEQLASFMAAQGCMTAYNLDGGDTALMWFKDDYYSRETKRSQSDIIYFATAVDPAATEE